MQTTHTEVLRLKQCDWLRQWEFNISDSPETVFGQEKAAHLTLWRGRGGSASWSWRIWTLLLLLLLRLVLGLVLRLRGGEARWWRRRRWRHRPQLVLVPSSHPLRFCSWETIGSGKPVIAIVAVVPLDTHHPCLSGCLRHTF